jgi:hypothetical protein
MSVYLTTDEDENGKEIIDGVVIDFDERKHPDRKISFVKQETDLGVRYGVHCGWIHHTYHPTLWMTEKDFKEFAKLAGELAAK